MPFSLTVKRNKRQSRQEILYVGGAFGMGRMSVFSQDRDVIIGPQAKRKRDREKNLCLKAPSFTVQLGPAQLFQVKELFSSELFQAQKHMGASLLFF